MALHDHEYITCHVLGCDIPCFAFAAYAQTLALAYGVVHETDMLAYYFAIRSFHRAGIFRQITVQEFAERTLADKTDAGAVFLVVVGQSLAFRDFPDFAFVQLAKWEKRL